MQQKNPLLKKQQMRIRANESEANVQPKPLLKKPCSWFKSSYTLFFLLKKQIESCRKCNEEIDSILELWKQKQEGYYRPTEQMTLKKHEQKLIKFNKFMC